MSEAPVPFNVASGLKPAVEYMLALNDDKGPFTVIPIEAKVNIEPKDIFQLSTYMMKLSTFENRLEFCFPVRPIIFSPCGLVVTERFV